MAKLTSEQIHHIETLAGKGVSGKKISDEMNVSHQTVLKYIKKYHQKQKTVNEAYNITRVYEAIETLKEQVMQQDKMIAEQARLYKKSTERSTDIEREYSHVMRILTGIAGVNTVVIIYFIYQFLRTL